MAGTITVRRATTRDAAAYARIMGDLRVLGGLMQVPYTSDEVWQARLADGNALGKNDLLLVAERDGAVVGTSGLHPEARLRRRHVAMLGISVAHEAQRTGVGRALMQAMCDWADGWAQLLRIELHVYTDNAAAIALYRAFGFEVEGTHRAHALRDGAYVDSLSMARLHPRPPLLPGAGR